MLKKFLIKTVLLALIGSPALAAVKAGDMAPDFTGVDSNGVSHSLSDFKGKTVVLEWKNHDCPFVVKHYATNNMQKLQKDVTSNDMIWLSINSSAKGKQGYTTADEANAIVKDEGSMATAVILDSSGAIGKMYDAKTTPEIFIIDESGMVIYDGAIDSIASTSKGDVEKAVNYVTKTLAEKKEGKPIEIASTTPYGCSVKY
ncbi:MAG: redoxin family protein [Rickettsiales bacterium]|nr:redoxin family protein [Rickettsiales bacterium]